MTPDAIQNELAEQQNLELKQQSISSSKFNIYLFILQITIIFSINSHCFEYLYCIVHFHHRKVVVKLFIYDYTLVTTKELFANIYF